MRQELREEDVQPRGIPLSLPQKYALDTNAPNVRDRSRGVVEEIGEKVLEVALRVSGRSNEDFAIIGLPELREFKGRAGFQIVDTQAMEEGRNDEVQIISVVVLRSRRDRDCFVPIIATAHDPNKSREEDKVLKWGEEIRSIIYREIEQEQGLPPQELLKTRVRAWVENFFEYLRESRLRMGAAVTAVTVLGGIGLAATVTTVQRFQEERGRITAGLARDNQALIRAGEWLGKARVAPSLDEKLQAIANMFDDGSLGHAQVTDALIKKLTTGGLKERKEAFQTISDILRIDLWRIDGRPPLKPLRGSSNGRALYEAVEDASKHERDSELRSRMSKTYEELRQLKEAPIPASSGDLSPGAR